MGIMHLYQWYANGCSGLQPVETSVLFGDLVGAADVVIYPEVGLLQTHLENFTEVSPPPPPKHNLKQYNYHRWASASIPMPPASVFRHPAS